MPFVGGQEKKKNESKGPKAGIREGPSGGRVAETEGRNVSVGSKAKLRVRT